MTAPLKLALFAAVLAAVFAAAIAVGTAVGPVGADGDSTLVQGPSDHGSDEHGSDEHGSDEHGSDEHGSDEHGDMSSTGSTSSGGVGGLAVSVDGYTLVPETTDAAPSSALTYRFTITDPDGAVVTSYEVNHEQRLHLIVVRRDLSGFRHVHPTLGTDGVWTIDLDLATPGTYRVFADFTPRGADRGLTLGADLTVVGDQQITRPAAPSATFVVDRYTVTLSGSIVAGEESELTLDVRRDGRPVTDLQPYLGAYGHLVALRSGDLGYVHVHPDGEPGDGRTEPGPTIVFHTTVPTTSTYRLYLDFRHDGVVRTAEFTVEAS